MIRLDSMMVAERSNVGAMDRLLRRIGLQRRYRPSIMVKGETGEALLKMVDDDWPACVMVSLSAHGKGNVHITFWLNRSDG